MDMRVSQSVSYRNNEVVYRYASQSVSQSVYNTSQRGVYQSLIRWNRIIGDGVTYLLINDEMIFLNQTEDVSEANFIEE